MSSKIVLLFVRYWGLLHNWDIRMLSLRVELKTSRLLKGGSNQLSYESMRLVVLLT